MKYRKKPVVIEAFCLWKEEVPKWWSERGDIQVYIHSTDLNLTEFKIPTLEGVMTARPGDYIIQGVQGEIYPCKPDIFEATYEAVEEKEGPQ